jgi:signal transduction histidine kinase
VLHSLLENALRFTEPGGRVVVAVASAPGEHGCRCPARVRTQADLPYVFERFFRSKASKRSIRQLGPDSRRCWIVEAHKGKVAVESAPGKGSTFTVVLPVI